jgi:hypothetical protein
MRGNDGCWMIFHFIVVHCEYSCYILELIHLVRNAHSRIIGNSKFLLIYSECTDYVDPHMMIIIFLIYRVYFMFFLTERFVLLYSILAIDIFIILCGLFVRLLMAYSTYIIGLIFLACYK